MRIFEEPGETNSPESLDGPVEEGVAEPIREEARLSDRLALQMLMVNQDALTGILGLTSAERSSHLPDDADTLTARARKQQSLTRLLEHRISDLGIVELPVAVARGDDLRGIVVAIDQAFYFRQDNKRDIATFRGVLPTAPAITVRGEVDRRRYPFVSTRGHLSGHPYLFMLGTVTATDDETIRVRPAFVGWRKQRLSSNYPEFDPMWRERRVYPQHIDQFSSADFSRAPSSRDLDAVKAMPERQVKESLAAILGQPFVEKDWGGERSDLRFDRLLVNGVQTSSSWLLKGGAGVRGPMYIADLGARGDQIERLTTDASELLVVQHARQITSPVVRMLESFANDMRQPRRYMVLDGADTAIILRDHGWL